MHRWYQQCPVSMLAALLLAVAPARADFVAAIEAYQAGRHESSAQAFERLAWSGHAPAQLNLAVQYANGQGVARDLGRAVGWAGIAADAGLAEARRLSLKLLPAQTESDMDAAMVLEKEYHAQAIESRMAADRPSRIEVPAKQLGRPPIVYPPGLTGSAGRDAWEGYLYLSLNVSADGRASNALILFSDPPGRFDAAAVKGMLATKWQPALVDGQPTATNPCASIQFQISDVERNSGVRQVVRELRAKAEQGDAASQFAGAILWSSYADARKYIRTDEAMRWFEDALEAEFPPSLLLTALCGDLEEFGPRAVELKRGRDGVADVRKAARLGFSPAQVVLAEWLLSDAFLPQGRYSLEQRTGRAIGWLEIAASGEHQAIEKIELARLLATTPVAALRDVQRARKLIEPLRAEWSFDPRVQDVLSAD